jgi:hypothetical protein
MRFALSVKLFNIHLYKLLHHFSPILHYETRMRQRNDVLKEMMLFIQPLKYFVVSAFAQTITNIGGGSNLFYLLLNTINNTRLAVFQQFFIIIIIQVDAVFGKP